MLKDEETASSSLWTLTFITDRLPHCFGRILSIPGFPEGLVAILGTTMLAALVPALRLTGTLLSDEDDEKSVDILLDADIVNTLSALLAHSRAGVRKEACWALSNIFGGSPAHVKHCLVSGALNSIIQLIVKEMRSDIRREAGWCLVNAFDGADREMLVHITATPDLLPALVATIENTDNALSEAAISATLKLITHGETLRGGGDASNPYLGYLSNFAQDLLENAAEAGSVSAQSIVEYFLPTSHAGDRTDPFL